jgi:hypothetical protein
VVADGVVGEEQQFLCAVGCERVEEARPRLRKEMGEIPGSPSEKVGRLPDSKDPSARLKAVS